MVEHAGERVAPRLVAESFLGYSAGFDVFVHAHQYDDPYDEKEGNCHECNRDKPLPLGRIDGMAAARLQRRIDLLVALRVGLLLPRVLRAGK